MNPYTPTWAVAISCASNNLAMIDNNGCLLQQTKYLVSEWKCTNPSSTAIRPSSHVVVANSQDLNFVWHTKTLYTFNTLTKLQDIFTNIICVLPRDVLVLSDVNRPYSFSSTYIKHSCEMGWKILLKSKIKSDKKHQDKKKCYKEALSPISTNNVSKRPHSKNCSVSHFDGKFIVYFGEAHISIYSKGNSLKS